MFDRSSKFWWQDICLSQEELDLQNLSTLQELLGERFKELVETFVRDSVERLQDLKSAIAERDSSNIIQHAHSLKGSSRNIGAYPLADLCDHMEKQARSGTIADPKQELAAIEQKLAAVNEILQTVI